MALEKLEQELVGDWERLKPLNGSIPAFSESGPASMDLVEEIFTVLKEVFTVLQEQEKRIKALEEQPIDVRRIRRPGN